jgi:hypothetical protein
MFTICDVRSAKSHESPGTSRLNDTRPNFREGIPGRKLANGEKEPRFAWHEGRPVGQKLLNSAFGGKRALAR